MKKMRHYNICFFILAAFATSLLVQADETPKPTPPLNPTEFHFTINQFIDRYNRAAEAVDSEIRLKLKSSDDNGEFVTAQLESNKNVALVVTATQDTLALQSITYISSGDGSFESGADTIIGSAAFVMAIEDPEMPVARRAEIFNDLGYTDENVDMYDRVEFVRENISYSKSYSDAIGLLLIAQPN